MPLIITHTCDCQPIRSLASSHGFRFERICHQVMKYHFKSHKNICMRSGFYNERISLFQTKVLMSYFVFYSVPHTRFN